MNAQDLLQRLPTRARFAGDTPVKLDCFRSGRLLVGLNCFEPGQTQKVHAHAGADKFYFVVSGKARFVLGNETIEEIGRASCRERGVDLGGRRIIKKKKKKKSRTDEEEEKE